MTLGKKIAGVKIRSANKEVIDEELKKAQLATGGSMPHKIARLNEYIRLQLCGVEDPDEFDMWLETNWEDPRILVCENCQGMSLSSMKLCPYCGNKALDADLKVKKPDPLKMIKDANKVKPIAGTSSVKGIPLGSVTLALSSTDVEQAPSCEERLTEDVMQKFTIVQVPDTEELILIVNRYQIEN